MERMDVNTCQLPQVDSRKVGNSIVLHCFCTNELSDPTFVGSILDVYVAQAPLAGDTFLQCVNTLLLTFITEYTKFEAIVCTATQKTAGWRTK